MQSIAWLIFKVDPIPVSINDTGAITFPCSAIDFRYLLALMHGYVIQPSRPNSQAVGLRGPRVSPSELCETRASKQVFQYGVLRLVSAAAGLGFRKWPSRTLLKAPSSKWQVQIREEGVEFG